MTSDCIILITRFIFSKWPWFDTGPFQWKGEGAIFGGGQSGGADQTAGRVEEGTHEQGSATSVGVRTGEAPQGVDG